MPTGVHLLGPVELTGPDGPVPVGPKERCLLAALAVHAGEVVPEPHLIEALWPAGPPRTAGKTLQNYVLRLRRAAQACPGVAVVTQAPGYRLVAGPSDAAIAVDQVAMARSAAARGEHAEALAALDAALAIWRGPALAEFADRDFARAEAARLDEVRCAAEEDRAAALLALGGCADAAAALEPLVADRPLRERRWTLLMLALYRDGQQAAALRAYQRLRAVLDAQLGVAPGPEAQALQAAVLAHDPGLLGADRAAVGDARTTTALVGRERELGVLREHLAAARAGRGGVVLVRGEAGIGKTRLLAELATCAAADGATLLTGRCPEGAGALPFHPFAEALADRPGVAEDPVLGALVPSSGAPPTTGRAGRLRPDELRVRLLDGVARHLTALTAAAPVVLLVDDLHWADSGTLAMLRHTARATAGRGLLVVAAYRPGEVDTGHLLDDTLAALHSEADCTVLRLAGISTVAVARLLHGTAGAPLTADLVAAVSAETRGNPFFAQEIVRQLREDGDLLPGEDGRLGTRLPLSAVPDGVRQVVARRRRRLSGPANRLLDAAAAIEGPFPFEPVRAVARLTPDEALGALDEVLAAELVVPDGRADRYDFTHALVRHSVRFELNPSRRLRLHRAVAEALGAARAAGERITAAEIAAQHHRAAALPGADAGVAPALEAADGARVAGAHDEHAAFVRMALDLLPATDPRRPGLLTRLATALAWAMRFDDAVAAARAAAAAGCGPGAVARVATALATAGSNRHAWRLAPIGLAATDGPDGADPAAWASLTLLDLDRREAADPDHPGMPLDLPGRRRALRILLGSGRLAGRGDLTRYARAAVHGRRSAVPAEAAEDATVAAFLLGHYAVAVALFERDATLARERGQLAWEVYCSAGAGRCRIALGDLDGGADTLTRTRALVDRLPGLARGWQLLHHQGTEDALVHARDEGWPELMAGYAPWLRPSPDQHWAQAGIEAIGARIEARSGHVEPAMALLGRPVRALRQAPAWAPNYGRIACEVADVLWVLGRRDHMAVVEEALRDRALPADFRFPMTDARLALGRLCALDGRDAEAARCFDEARAVLEEQGARPLRAIVDHDEALLHARAGRPAAAEAPARAAAEAFARMGMPGWLRRASALARGSLDGLDPAVR